MGAPAATVHPIDADAAPGAAQFLKRELNPRVDIGDWISLLQPPWADRGPNHGFLLRSTDGEIVGVYAAVYSRRGDVTTCNLAAFSVLESYRAHSLRLIRALLTQKDVAFTDFSPSGNVVAMNERLGMRRIDTSTRLIVNVPAWSRRARIVIDHDTIARTLTGADAQAHRDHRDAPACHHLIIVRGDRVCYLVYRRDRRKRMPLFASPLYLGGDRELLAEHWGLVRGHLLSRGLPFTLAEHRVLGVARGLGKELSHPRAKMFRGDDVDPATLDYLYSELALVRW